MRLRSHGRPLTSPAPPPPPLVLQTAPAALTDLQIRLVSKLMHRSTAETLDSVFGGAYTQPELLHPEITDPPSQPLKRTVLAVSCWCNGWCGKVAKKKGDPLPEEAPPAPRPSRAAVWLHSFSQVVERDDSAGAMIRHATGARATGAPGATGDSDGSTEVGPSRAPRPSMTFHRPSMPFHDPLLRWISRVPRATARCSRPTSHAA